MLYFHCWSGGKDSTASVILDHEMELPPSTIVMSEVMFDKTRGITGENPAHMEWVHTKAKPLFESWGLVNRFGLALKVFNNRLVVFNEGTYEARSPVATLGESDFDPGWTWNTTLDGTYTGVKYQYTNSDKDKVFTVTAGNGNRILTCNEAAENLTEATVIALAALNNANKKTTTMKITIRACRKIIATSCVEIVGLGKLSGKYFVEEVAHSIGSGYKMSLSLRKVEARFTKASSYSSSVAEAANGTTSTDASETVSQTQSQNFEKGGTYELTVTKKGYYTAAEAVAGAASGGHPTSVCKPGSYYIFNTTKGMLNITKKRGSPGSWINPN